MISLYAQYITEVANRHILEEPYGFITYEFEDKICYIADFFIVKEERGRGVELFERVKAIAKDNGCFSVMGRVDAQNKLCSKLLSVYLRLGFKVIRAESGGIFLGKDI